MLNKVVVKYDGSQYFGWQVQRGKNRNVKTVASVINKEVSKINKRKTEVVASGRTDRKVHALGQVFHFKNDFDIPADRLKRALNNALADDIEVISVEEVDKDFHARFSAKSKEYHYYLNMGEYDLFKKDYITQYNKALDYSKMQEAAKLIVGSHNFKNFNTTPLGEKANQKRNIYKLEIEKQEDLLIFKIKGDSFLRNMVRMIVGVLVYIGANKYNIKDLENLLKKDNPSKEAYNIEPQGLYLVKVNYEEEI